MSDHRCRNPWAFRLLALPLLLAWLPATVHAEIPTHSVLLPVVEVPLRVPLGQSEIMRLPRQSGTVLVADPQIAGVQIASPQVIMILGKSIGKTSIAIFDQTGELMVEKIVQVAFDLQPARSSLQSSPELSKLTLTRRNRSVEIRGSVASAELVHQALELILSALPEGVSIVNRISVLGPQQVNLEVQIAEIRRSVSESLGLNWRLYGVQTSSGLATTEVLTQVGAYNFDNNLSLFGSFTPDEGAGVPAIFDIRRRIGSIGVRAVIEALAMAGMASVLARPNLTAVSGETASFFSGGEYPVPSGFDDGELTYEFKKFGVLLDFVPTVLNNDRISLTVRPEVSQQSRTIQSLEIDGVRIPGVDVRRAETTVEVGNNQSVVIGGLYQGQSTSGEDGIPGLMELPVLGRLFGTREATSNTTELVVVVTARLIRPAGKASGSGERQEPSVTRTHGYYY